MCDAIKKYKKSSGGNPLLTKMSLRWCFKVFHFGVGSTVKCVVVR